MTAEAIRKLLADRVSPEPGSLEHLWLTFVCEIAAQLAEMNERAAKPEIEKLRQELREEIDRWRTATRAAQRSGIGKWRLEGKARAALELYLKTYADTQTHPTPAQEAAVINAVREVLA